MNLLQTESVIIIIIVVIFLAHRHKAAGRKTTLDIQNYGCNGNLLCYHGVMERNRVVVIDYQLLTIITNIINNIIFVVMYRSSLFTCQKAY